MKILIFNWRDISHPWAGGAELNTHEQAKRWVKDGHKVTLFCGTYDGCNDYDKIDGVEIVRRGGVFSVYFWAFLYYLSKFRGKYDVIVDVENGVPFFTPLYSLCPKVIIVHHVHRLQFFREFGFPLNWTGYLLETKFMPILYRRVNFVAVSPSTKKELTKIRVRGKKIKVIYNGLDHLLYQNSKKKTKNPTIVYLGRLKEYKRLEIIINMMPRLLKDFPNLVLHIAGEGEKRRFLQDLARRLKVKTKVKFHGYVSERKKVKLLQSSWLFVTPSLNEGWGLAVLEANACGTTAVAFDVPGLNNAIINHETGFLIREGDKEAFFKAVVKLLKNKKLRQKLSQKAFVWSQNFSWDKSAKKSLKILRRVIDGQTK